MSVNGGERCVVVFVEVCSTGKHDAVLGKADLVVQLINQVSHLLQHVLSLH